MLHKVKHAEVVDLVSEKLARAASVYECRDFGTGCLKKKREIKDYQTHRETAEKSCGYRKKQNREKTAGDVRETGGSADGGTFYSCKGFGGI